ncbi:MAG: ACP phosphodiesterase [Bacteroidota bacterium]
MNFLAHLYLSREEEELMIGNFIADSVKGRAFLNFSAGIRRGILLHRAIDHFTDQHPVTRTSVNRLRPAYGKYSGVIIDIFYDHFLAAGWSRFSEQPLADFSSSVQAVLVRHRPIMPLRSQQFLEYMIRKNIPMPYATLQGIEEVLYGMSRRAKFENRMYAAVGDLSAHYRDFGQEFELFFPELCRFAEQKKSELAKQ